MKYFSSPHDNIHAVFLLLMARIFKKQSHSHYHAAKWRYTAMTNHKEPNIKNEESGLRVCQLRSSLFVHNRDLSRHLNRATYHTRQIFRLHKFQDSSAVFSASWVSSLVLSSASWLSLVSLSSFGLSSSLKNTTVSLSRNVKRRMTSPRKFTISLSSKTQTCPAQKVYHFRLFNLLRSSLTYWLVNVYFNLLKYKRLVQLLKLLTPTINY